MKTIAVSLFALVALTFPFVSQAATPAQVAAVDAWKKEFPAAARTDSAKLTQFIAGYQLSVGQMKAGATKILVLLRDKLARDLASTERVLHPPKPNPKITPAMQVDAQDASRWLNEKFAPYLARAPK